MGAPLFDDTWGVLGLHKSSDEQGRRTFVAIAELTRELESSPCWDEIAAAHRLVRRVEATPPDAPLPSESPDIVRAVHWNPDDTKPMSERERRRAIKGAGLADLKTA